MAAVVFSALPFVVSVIVVQDLGNDPSITLQYPQPLGEANESERKKEKESINTTKQNKTQKLMIVVLICLDTTWLPPPPPPLPIGL